MQRHVHLQIPPGHVTSVAHLAHKGPIVLVDAQMHFQIAITGERLVTLGTRKPNSRVGDQLVLLQQIPIGELLATLATFERFQSEVAVFMILESLLALEGGLFANVTPE